MTRPDSENNSEPPEQVYGPCDQPELKTKRRQWSRNQVASEDQLTASKEDLKQALQSKAQRLRRYIKRSEQYKQNKRFRDDTKRFYRELGKKTIQIETPPDIAEVKKFWQNILEQEVKHNEDAQGIKDQEEQLQINQMEWNDITVEELQVNMTRAANSVVINDPQQIPEWLVEGTTNLLPKKEETWIPKNYIPIVCLPTTFKILTSVITDRLYNHLENESIMTPQQRGGKKDCYGCKEQLMINNAILENCKAKKKNVSTAWIDYKKAFDSVPHSWIVRCLQMYKIHPVLIKFIEKSMNHWKTNMTLVHKQGVLETGPIRIKRGIFQGDSLSPLLFTMSLNPLSIELNKTKYGYQLDKQTKINHLFYEDDLKLYGTNDNQLAGLINTVKHVSDDTKMEFGLDKCAKATFKRGKKVQAEGIQLNDNQVIQDLEQSETYKYLGMEEGEGLQHHEMKVKIRKEYKRRVKLVLKSELNGRNKIAAMNTLAVPVIVYSYGIINWKLDEIQDLDRITRKQLCMNLMLAKKADIDRIYLPCPEGGRSLMNLEIEYKATTVGLHKYMTGKNDPQIQAILRHLNSKALHSVPKEAAKYLNEAGTIQDLTIDINRTVTWKAKQLKLKYKKDAKKMIKDKWKDKAMHGKFSKYLDKDHIDMQLSFEWMKHTGLKDWTHHSSTGPGTKH